MLSKICSICKINLTLDKYNKSKDTKLGVRSCCIECRKVKETEYRRKKGVKEKTQFRSKVWYNNNKLRAKNNSLMCSYNITLDDYNKMLNEQNEKCAICEIHKDNLKKSLCVDHCHNTSKVRGLLCDKCNVTLGNIKDSIYLLEKCIKYLKK